MKNISILLLFSLLTSCNSIKKERYKVVNSFLKVEFDANKRSLNSKQQKNDTILIIRESTPLKDISSYSLNWDKTENSIPKYMKENVYWIDSTKTINLDQPNIGHIRQQMENEKPFYWNQKNIKSLNRIVVPKDRIFNSDSKYNVINLKKEMGVYYLSIPILNIKKDVAIFGFYTSKNFNSTMSKPRLIIMKKENGKWLYIGYIISSASH